MESLVKTIRGVDGVETREYFADADIETVREGWFVLQVKSLKNPRDESEMGVSTFVDGLRFEPKQKFQCHPEHAKILIERERVDIVKKPKKEEPAMLLSA